MLSYILFVNDFVQEYRKQHPICIDEPSLPFQGLYSRTVNILTITTFCRIIYDNMHAGTVIDITSDKSIIEEIPKYHIQPFEMSLLNMILSKVPKHVRLIDLYETCNLNNLDDNLVKVNNKIVINFMSQSRSLHSTINIINLLAVHMNDIREYYEFGNLREFSLSGNLINNRLSIIIYLKLQDILSSIDVIRDTALFMLSFIESIKIY